MGPDAPALDLAEGEREAAEAAGQPAFMRLQGPNLWPAEPAVFRPAVEQMFTSMGGVCSELMRGAALALGQPEDVFAPYFADADTAMKLKCCSYPTAESTACGAEPESHGVGPHKDYGFLAVIESDVAGLQVLDRKGEWFSVPLLEGAFVVNGGELLELASGGAFMAATHRVAATGADVGRARLSLCFFYNPGFNTVVQPVPTLPPQLASAASANRAVRSAAAAAGEGRDLYGEEPRP